MKPDEVRDSALLRRQREALLVDLPGQMSVEPSDFLLDLRKDVVKRSGIRDLVPQ